MLGVIENMSGLVCPHCSGRIELFKTGGGEQMAAQMGVPFLGRLPIDPSIVSACDEGKPFVAVAQEGKTAENLRRIIEEIVRAQGP